MRERKILWDPWRIFSRVVGPIRAAGVREAFGVGDAATTGGGVEVRFRISVEVDEISPGVESSSRAPDARESMRTPPGKNPGIRRSFGFLREDFRDLSEIFRRYLSVLLLPVSSGSDGSGFRVGETRSGPVASTAVSKKNLWRGDARGLLVPGILFSIGASVGARQKNSGPPHSQILKLPRRIARTYRERFFFEKRPAAVGDEDPEGVLRGSPNSVQKSGERSASDSVPVRDLHPTTRRPSVPRTAAGARKYPRF